MGRRNELADVFKHINMSPEPPCTCWLWTGAPSENGLPYFRVGGKMWIAYRAVYKLMHPEWDETNRRNVIRHKCVDAEQRPVDNPLCCNPAHLGTGTQDENMNDMMVRGRKGLTRDALSDILDIVRNQPNLTHSQIAAMVSYKHKIPVARQTVTDILARRRRRVLRDLIETKDAQIINSGRSDDK